MQVRATFVTKCDQVRRGAIGYRIGYTEGTVVKNKRGQDVCGATVEGPVVKDGGRSRPLWRSYCHRVVKTPGRRWQHERPSRDVRVTHESIVPTPAGLAPYCSCGWPETEGGRKMVWRSGDKTLAAHLREVAEG